MLLALLVGLPVVLIGVVPPGSFAFAGTLSSLVPFGHAVDLATAALYETDPWRNLVREGAWLLGLTLAFAAVARLTVKRLLV